MQTYVIGWDIRQHTLSSDLGIFGAGHLEAGDLVGELLSGVRNNLEHGAKITHVRTVDYNGSVWGGKSGNKVI